MTDIELVIKIPEERYNQILDKDYILGHYLEIAVRNGTPLPKGHDRLVDMKNLQNFVSQYTEHDAVQLILADRENYIPTVVEADIESEGNNEL